MSVDDLIGKKVIINGHEYTVARLWILPNYVVLEGPTNIIRLTAHVRRLVNA